MGKRKERLTKAGLKPEYHCASVSWGAGSVYMLLSLLEDPQSKLNIVIFVNMGQEFSATLKVRDKVLPILEARSVSYVELDVSKEFAYDMYQRPVRSRETGDFKGYGYHWCGNTCRYGTSLKLQALQKFYRQNLADKYTIVEYIGICADEEKRQYRNYQDLTIKRYPLIEWGISKREAVQGCYAKGYFFEEHTLSPYAEKGEVFLYEILDNASCVICRNKNLRELKALYYLLPQYWERLREVQRAFPDEPMKGPGKSVFELEKRFLTEGRAMSIFESIPMPNLKAEEFQYDR